MSLTDTINSINSAQNAANGLLPLNQSSAQQFQGDGFTVPASFQATQNQLPYSQVPSYKPGVLHRNIITWYVPQFGTVQMFVNPSAITYAHRKLITKDRTKGGYTLQYWGEDLITLNISGTTGSSGIEGINALYEVYRAEQYAFDSVGLAMAANNASSTLAGNLINGIGGALGSGINSLFTGGSSNTASTVGSGILGGILGLNSPTNTLAPNNIPSLAQLAFSVEVYYGGEIYRGFFDSMTINERSDNFLMEYQIVFMATQRRGFRLNYFPFTNSANNGYSRYNTPPAFSGHASVGQ